MMIFVFRAKNMLRSTAFSSFSRMFPFSLYLTLTLSPFRYLAFSLSFSLSLARLLFLTSLVTFTFSYMNLMKYSLTNSRLYGQNNVSPFRTFVAAQIHSPSL